MQWYWHRSPDGTGVRVTLAGRTHYWTRVIGVQICGWFVGIIGGCAGEEPQP